MGVKRFIYQGLSTAESYTNKEIDMKIVENYIKVFTEPYRSNI